MLVSMSNKTLLCGKIKQQAIANNELLSSGVPRDVNTSAVHTCTYMHPKNHTQPPNLLMFQFTEDLNWIYLKTASVPFTLEIFSACFGCDYVQAAAGTQSHDFTVGTFTVQSRTFTCNSLLVATCTRCVMKQQCHASTRVSLQ